MNLEGTDLDRPAATEAPEKVDTIRDEIEREVKFLTSAIRQIVRSRLVGRPPQEVMQRADEVLNEAVCRALSRPHSFQEGRPVAPWIMGIALNVLRGEARAVATVPKRVDMDDAAFDRLLETLDPHDRRSVDRMDVAMMLARLTESERHALECRFLKGLEGRALVEALGVPSMVAARQRVHRAVQTLKDIFAQDDAEEAR